MIIYVLRLSGWHAINVRSLNCDANDMYQWEITWRPKIGANSKHLINCRRIYGVRSFATCDKNHRWRIYMLCHLTQFAMQRVNTIVKRQLSSCRFGNSVITDLLRRELLSSLHYSWQPQTCQNNMKLCIYCKNRDRQLKFVRVRVVKLVLDDTCLLLLDTSDSDEYVRNVYEGKARWGISYSTWYAYHFMHDFLRVLVRS